MNFDETSLARALPKRIKKRSCTWEGCGRTQSDIYCEEHRHLALSKLMARRLSPPRENDEETNQQTDHLPV